jgi:hypothetical protein
MGIQAGGNRINLIDGSIFSDISIFSELRGAAGFWQ